MEGLSTTLVYVGIGSLLAIGVAILTVAVLLLRTVRRYVALAEERLELLREGEALLLRAAQQGHAEEQNREREPERRERVPEVVGHPLGQQRKGEDRRPEASDPHVRKSPGISEQESFTEDGEQKPEKTQKAGSPGGAVSRPKDGAPLLGVKVAHPDDDVTLRDWNSSATKFFQKCYDRYLEHYEGYVRLAGRLHQMHDETSPGALGAREWEEKMRRAYDAIERTTQRLDILEEHYPELATDSERISSRISTARLHAGLAERLGRPH
jgi:hypothetical protein